MGYITVLYTDGTLNGIGREEILASQNPTMILKRL